MPTVYGVKTMLDINEKRITVFAGHYGSGKTNLSVNYALALRKRHDKVMVCDVDTVNPYFRTKDSEKVFAEHGIRLVGARFANTNLDIPSIMPDTFAAFHSSDMYSVFDVGGDDAGALALGQFAELISETEHDMLLVVNKYRLQTSKPEDLMQYVREIERASKIQFTAIINNPNLGRQTTKDCLLSSLDYIEEASRLSSLPVKWNCLREDLIDDEVRAKVPNLFPIKVFYKENWHIEEEN